MSAPRRWRDDPELCAELGIDLSREAHLDEAVDLPALKGRLLSAVQTGALPTVDLAGPGTFSAKAVLLSAVVGAAAGALGMGWVLSQGAPPPAAVTVVTEAPPLADEPSLAAEPPVQPAPSDVPPKQPASAGKTTRSKPESAPPQAPARGTLAEQLRLYERGEAALQRGHHAIAIRELGRYLQLYPEGDLREEAELSLLHARLGAGRHEEVLLQVERLLREGELAHRRGELLRAKGEALFQLWRCEEGEQAFRAALLHPDANLDPSALATRSRGCQEASETDPRGSGAK